MSAQDAPPLNGPSRLSNGRDGSPSRPRLIKRRSPLRPHPSPFILLPSYFLLSRHPSPFTPPAENHLCLHPSYFFLASLLQSPEFFRFPIPCRYASLSAQKVYPVSRGDVPNGEREAKQRGRLGKPSRARCAEDLLAAQPIHRSK